MEENNNEEVVVVEEDEPSPQKVGFEPMKPGQKKNIHRFQKDLPHKSYRNVTKVFTIIGVVTSIISFMYFFLPVFSSVIGGILLAFIYLFIIASVILTLGILLLSEEYRQWIGFHANDIPNYFFNFANHIVELGRFYLIFGIPGVVFTLTGLILAIVGASKKYRYFGSYIVLCAIFFVVALVCTIFYMAMGFTLAPFGVDY